MIKRWTTQENNILSDLLLNGVEVKVLTDALVGRTQDAIIRRASSNGYRVVTKNGVKTFYHGIKRRSRQLKDTAIEQNLAVTNSDAISNIIQVDIVADNDYNSKIFSTGLDANAIAIKMLNDHSLKIEPLIVYQLSEHILKQDKE